MIVFPLFGLVFSSSRLLSGHDEYDDGQTGLLVFAAVDDLNERTL